MSHLCLLLLSGAYKISISLKRIVSPLSQRCQWLPGGGEVWIFSHTALRKAVKYFFVLICVDTDCTGKTEPL